MTEAQARRCIEIAMLALQRIRSITQESADGIDEKIFGFFMPWLFGRKCPLMAFQKMLDRETIEPMDFYNAMTIAHRFVPELAAMASFGYDIELPEPDIAWLKGWEHDTNKTLAV